MASLGGAGVLGDIFNTALTGLQSGLESRDKAAAAEAEQARKEAELDLQHAQESRLYEGLGLEKSKFEEQLKRPTIMNMGPNVIGVFDSRTGELRTEVRPKETDWELQQRSWQTAQKQRTEAAWEAFRADPTIPEGIKTAAELLGEDKKHALVEQYVANKYGFAKLPASSTRINGDLAAQLIRMGHNPNDPKVRENADLMAQAQELADARKEKEQELKDSRILNRALTVGQVNTALAGERDVQKDTQEGLRNIKGVEASVDLMDKQLKELVPKATQGRLFYTALDPISKFLQIPGRGEKLAAFGTTYIDIGNTIRALGERGVLTNQDRDFVLSRLPTPTDTYGVYLEKVRLIKERLEAARSMWMWSRSLGFNRVEDAITAAGGRLVLPNPSVTKPSTTPTTPTPSKGSYGEVIRK